MKKVYIIFIIFSFLSCNKIVREQPYENIDFKEEMRNFVIGINHYSKSFNPNFYIIPQNGIELITQNGTESGNIHNAYIDAIDGQAQEGLFYGYEQDDEITPTQITAYLKQFLNKAKTNRKKILITDYCFTPSHIVDSYHKNNAEGYACFVATSRELDLLPSVTINNVNNNHIENLSDVQNFLYLINSHQYIDKSTFLSELRASNYDLLIIDAFFNDGTAFTRQDINALKYKTNGTRCLVIAYMSIGEAEDYRYYWKQEWNTELPAWISMENPQWPGNYKVKYWEKEWQNIIYGNDDSYVKKIIDSEFDGVYLDIIDAFEFFESRY